MNYRKIPFVRAGSSLMNGLAPIVSQSPAQKSRRTRPRLRPGAYILGYGPMYPGSSMLGHISKSKFFGEESGDNDNGIVNDYDPLFRNKETMPFALDGLGDALPAGTSQTVMLRAQPGAPPGFPGFFAWLKSEQPAMWNYAKVALPAYVTQAEGKRTGGATLSGLGHISLSKFFGEESADNDNGIVNDYDPLFRNKSTMAYQVMNGLGDDDTDSTTLIDPSSIDTISTPMPTVSIPDTSAETASVGTPPNPGASAVASIVSTLTAAAPSILADVNSQTLFNTNLARAQAGLPPLNTSAYGLTSSLSSMGSALPLLLIGGGLLVFMLAKK